MIDILKLTKNCVGREVLYSTHFKSEKGIIKSWNDKYIFVVYKYNNEPENFMNYTAAATDPVDLQWA